MFSVFDDDQNHKYAQMTLNKSAGGFHDPHAEIDHNKQLKTFKDVWAALPTWQC